MFLITDDRVINLDHCVSFHKGNDSKIYEIIFIMNFLESSIHVIFPNKIRMHHAYEEIIRKFFLVVPCIEISEYQDEKS